MAQPNWNPSLYDQKHSFVTEYGKELLALLAPQPADRILDIGCGTGHLTRLIADSGARVIGLDSSPQMIESARQNYPDIEFMLADASDFALDAKFDAVFSNATLHWVTRAEEAVACISRALVRGGRFVAEFGGKGNTANVIAAVRESIRELTRREIQHGWYYPSIGEYAALLEKHGLAVRYAHLFDRPTKLEGEDGMRNWLIMFGSRMFQDLSDETRQQALSLIEGKLRNKQYVDGEWFVDYRRLRIVADKL
ncbi:MAG: putative trans-aconitate 2-methyltransferase [Acidobacteria bacterium]|nr:putative trans-aconitate 2-methyltransferase [Acidobacteriota bacterium]